MSSSSASRRVVAGGDGDGDGDAWWRRSIDRAIDE